MKNVLNDDPKRVAIHAVFRSAVELGHLAAYEPAGRKNSS
jgi:hypothetical protein